MNREQYSQRDTSEAASLSDSLKQNEVARDIFDEETLDSMEDLDFEDALGLAYGMILDKGKDPEEFLSSLGILELKSFNSGN